MLYEDTFADSVDETLDRFNDPFAHDPNTDAFFEDDALFDEEFDAFDDFDDRFDDEDDVEDDVYDYDDDYYEDFDGVF